MHIGFGELIILLGVGLIIFSASRMSSLGNTLGKFVYSFKKAAKGDDFVDVKPTHKLSPSGRVVDGEVVDPNKKHG